MNGPFDGFLLAYFANGDAPDAEQVRFAVTPGPSPEDWIPIANGSPILRSDAGAGGARDPFILRDERRQRFVVIATDLRIHPGGDWERAVRFGSRSIAIWESSDLVTWSTARLVEIGPPEAGNVWAPKAFWNSRCQTWRIFFAAALYDNAATREAAVHQRILTVDTPDFREFSAPRMYWDPGHDVIDVTFLEWQGELSRFAADSLTDDDANRWQFVRQDRSASIDTASARLVSTSLGRGTQARAEGPAPFVGLDGCSTYLLLDEFEARGYQLYRSEDPHTGDWEHIAGARLPTAARHGSVIPIRSDERVILSRLSRPRSN